MARYHYVILCQAVPGREAEFDEWYDTRHLHDVRRMDGVVSARRFNLDFQKVYDLDAPQWHSMTIYELDCDDPQALLDRIVTASKTAAMPLSDAMTKLGMVQVVAHQMSALD